MTLGLVRVKVRVRVMVKVRFKVRFRIQKNSGLGLRRHSVNGIWDTYPFLVKFAW